MMTYHHSTLMLRRFVLVVFGFLAVYGNQARAGDLENGIYEIEFRFTGTGEGEALVRNPEIAYTTEVVEGEIKGQWLRIGLFQAHISGSITGDYAKVAVNVIRGMWSDRDIRFEGPIQEGQFYDEAEAFTSGCLGPFVGILRMTYLGPR